MILLEGVVSDDDNAVPVVDPAVTIAGLPVPGSVAYREMGILGTTVIDWKGVISASSSSSISSPTARKIDEETSGANCTGIIGIASLVSSDDSSCLDSSIPCPVDGFLNASNIDCLLLLQLRLKLSEKDGSALQKHDTVCFPGFQSRKN